MEDNTGDSGRGTGSETGPYSTVEIWRQAMKNPPPGMEYAIYYTHQKEDIQSCRQYNSMCTGVDAWVGYGERHICTTAYIAL